MDANTKNNEQPTEVQKMMCDILGLDYNEIMFTEWNGKRRSLFCEHPERKVGDVVWTYPGQDIRNIMWGKTKPIQVTVVRVDRKKCKAYDGRFFEDVSYKLDKKRNKVTEIELFDSEDDVVFAAHHHGY